MKSSESSWKCVSLEHRLTVICKFSPILDPSGTYGGELIFDLPNKRITPKVTACGEREDGQELGQQSDRAKKKRAADELSQLSGGEKSFGTACFVMSLWKCVVEAPFRLMDEVNKLEEWSLLELEWIAAILV